MDLRLINERARLEGSLLEFTQTFYYLRTGRPFVLSDPPGRESHYITICKHLTKAFRGEISKLCIHVPPRYGKTELMIHFVAWALAQHPDSNFMYLSFGHTLAKRQTQTIREIVQLPHYRTLFGVQLKEDSQAKDEFATTQGGVIYAAGASGTVTGMGAGVKGADRFGGAFIMDDMHKPDEATSDTIRDGVIDWFFNTAQSRTNSPTTPFIYIGQRVHEADLAAKLAEQGWTVLSLPAIDLAGNALHPEMHNLDALRKMQETSPYEFAAQYQQDPQPAGGGLFKPDWFVLHDEEPEILATFITADTAESEKTYADATVFGFWGIYKIKHAGLTTDLVGLHCLDIIELRLEPKDIEFEFLQFYRGCLMHAVKPDLAVIEKKSTGVTLVSTVNKLQGLQVISFERKKNKTERFLHIQPYIASKRVSFTRYARHVHLCIEHMRKITANQTHRHDDIADNFADAVNIALIEKVIQNRVLKPSDNINAHRLMAPMRKVISLKDRRKFL